MYCHTTIYRTQRVHLNLVAKLSYVEYATIKHKSFTLIICNQSVEFLNIDTHFSNFDKILNIKNWIFILA